MNSKDAINLLKNGNQRFASNTSAYSNSDPDRRAKLANGQTPFAIVLTCSDSRVVPEVVFDKRLGDLFVIRIAGNVLSDHVIGSIEYSIEHLGSAVVVVLGHEKCGAVKAAVDGYNAQDHIASLVKEITPSVDKTRGMSGDHVHNAVKENVIEQVQKLKESMPIIKEFVNENKIEVLGAVYDLESGKVNWL